MNLPVFVFIGTPEIMMIMLIIVMLFGSKKIPELARGLGKGIREFKNATGDIQEEIRKSAAEIKEQADIVDPLKRNPKSKKED